MSEHPLKALHELLYPYKEYIPPFSDRCIFCGKSLIKGVDEDHSVCNSCWSETFDYCKYGHYEEGNEFLPDCINEVLAEDDEPYDGTYFVEGL